MKRYGTVFIFSALMVATALGNQERHESDSTSTSIGGDDIAETEAPASIVLDAGVVSGGQSAVVDSGDKGGKDDGLSIDDGYRYGQDLDVHEVISIDSEPGTGACGLTTETMVYRDSHGRTHTLKYEVPGDACQAP